MKRGKRAQMKLSFGMIFSIILIVAFLAFAFYGIKAFLKIQDKARVGVFLDDFKNDVNKIWKSSQASQEIEYAISSKVEKICFIEDEYPENLIIEPEREFGEFSPTEIKHLDIGKITTRENPYCIESENGKINIFLKKDFDDNLVFVARANEN